MTNSIQWFPGHMKDTELFLKKALLNIDILMEIVDARLPFSSSNPILDKINKNNSLRIKVLNKKDLADDKITNLWIDYFDSFDQLKSIAVTGTDNNDTWNALELALSKFQKLNPQKLKSRKLRVMVAGIPNSGKSTIMNTLAGKKIAKTGNVPAITKHQQRTTLKNKIDIYDTPGILPPVIESDEEAYKLAASGAIADTAIDYKDIALFIVKFLIENYPDYLKQRYQFLNIDDINTIDIVRFNEVEIIEKIGKERGCLKKGGIVDFQKASELITREFRAGKIGKISLEKPEIL